MRGRWDAKNNPRDYGIAGLENPIGDPHHKTTHIRVVTRHQRGISAFVLQMSFCWKASGGIAKYLLFSKTGPSLLICAFQLS